MISTIQDAAMRKKVLGGLAVVKDIVTATMGAKGFNIDLPHAVRTSDGMVTNQVITKDGITVLQSLILHEDKWVRYAANKVFDAVEKQWRNVGDATTLTTLLCCEFYSALVQMYEADPTQNIHKLAGDAKAKIAEYIVALEKSKKTINNVETLCKIATVSANNDKELGKIIGETVFQVGVHGNVKAKLSENKDTTVDLYMGYSLNGVSDPAYVAVHKTYEYSSDNAPAILVTTQQLQKTDHIQKIIEIYLKLQKGEPRPLIVLCADFTGACRDTLNANQQQRVKGGHPPLHIFPVIHEFEGENRLETISDLQLLTGCTTLGAEYKNPKNMCFEDLGYMEHVEISPDKTFLRYERKEERLKSMVNLIDMELDKNPAKQRKDWLEMRKAKLVSGYAIINIGGSTYGERGAREDLADDSVKACMAALKDGYVLGGGYALANLVIDDKPNMLAKCLLSHLITNMMLNGGHNSDVIIDKLGENLAIDINTGDKIHLDHYEVFDAYKSIAHALEVSMSFASTLITTKHILTHD